jgi:predicted lipoprotein with Yx(FWY)xxD motif
VNMDTEENKELQSEATEPISEPVITTAENKRKCAPAAVLIMVIALACLAVVVFFIFSAWTMPTAEAPVVEVAETPTEAVEPAPVETVAEDPTNVPDRDPAVLGLRIDTVLGSILTERATGKTLYVTADECVGACLTEWTPYLAEEAVVDGGDLGTLERVDTGALQYTWKGSGLYLFNGDTSEHSVLGDGYEGVWSIARP